MSEAGNERSDLTVSDDSAQAVPSGVALQGGVILYRVAICIGWQSVSGGNVWSD